MKWFRKKEPEFDVVTNDVPLSTVYRWYLYDIDMTDDVNELAEDIGLSPVSEEGELKELEDSEARLKNVLPLFNFLDSMSTLSSIVMSSVHAKQILTSEPDANIEDLEQVLDSMHDVYKAIALSTLIGTFSSALELGIIQSNTISSNTYLTERDDNE